MDAAPKTVMFWRNGRWHVGWLQQDWMAADAGEFRVAWIEGPCLYTKIVDKVVPVDLDFELVSQPMK